MDLLPAALYTLVPISDSDLSDLQTLCESQSEVDVPGRNIALPPIPSTQFVGKSLKDVMDYHLELISRNHDSEGFDIPRFVVVVDEDWRTKAGGSPAVMLVTLDDDELECRTDMFRVRAEDVGLQVIGLNLGNTDWEESKEGYAIVEGDEEGGDGEGGGEGEILSSPYDPGEVGAGPVPSRGPTLLGFYIGVYALEGVDLRELIWTLEVVPDLKTEKEFSCRMQGVFPEKLEEGGVVRRAMEVHAERCARNPWLHKIFFLVADSVDPGKDGLVLVSMGGEVEREAGLPGGRGTVRYPVRATKRVGFSAVEATQNQICNLAQGKGWDEDWS